VTQLSKLAILGLAKESVYGTYQAPTVTIPFTKADFEDTTAEIRDESYRANDTTVQGIYAGVQDATWQIDVMSYPDLAGHFLRGIIGPDTVTAGVSTVLSSNTLVGATSIQTTLSIPTGSTIRIQDAGGLNVEYATTGVPTGTGPFTLPIVTPSGGLAFAHTAAGGSVTSQTQHAFKQSSSPMPGYSLTVFDTLTTIGYAGGKLSDLQIKIDPKAAVSLSAKYSTFPGASDSSMTPTYTIYPPALGWQWVMTNAGATSSRGLTYDVTLKRATESIHSSDGVQSPREIFSGTIDMDGAYKAIFENQTDLNLFAQYSQQPATATLTQPLSAGGEVLTITTSKSGWYKAKRDLGPTYVQADYTLSGIFNTTDGGAVQATLSNFVTTAY